MKTIAIAQARMGSTRVPGKVIRRLGGFPVLVWTDYALRSAVGIDKIIIATTTNEQDDAIIQTCQSWAANYFRGSETDVLDRFYQCAKEEQADVILRLTCDCPFLDPQVISEVIKLRELTNADYCSNINPPTYPDGLDVECFSFNALEAAWREATRPSDRDTVTQFMVRNRSRFPAANLTCPLPGLEKERWVLDTEDDWTFCNKLVEGSELWPGECGYTKILDILKTNPEWRKINNAQLGTLRNERFFESIYQEPVRERSFTRSTAGLERARSVIPFGAQTFSKSHIQYPAGASPLLLSHGYGARVFDVDGNDYIDLVSALLPVILGYCDPDVDRSICQQLSSGISFSLATELEAQLAETLCRLIPCAEMVKFGKNGTDVTTAAIRLARAYTGRDHVIVGGYHGWANWSMAVTDRNLGIPTAVAALSHRSEKNGYINIAPNKVAAWIIEPNEDPEELKRIRKYCDKYGIVLIFDEVITGFRYHLGGAQTLWAVTPDLATFGKAMANGMPLSALVGRREIMKRLEPPDNIFYSGTFFGEALSLAASIATIAKLEREDVIGRIWSIGAQLEHKILKQIHFFGLETTVKLSGLYPNMQLNFKDDAIRTLFMQEMIQQGILIIKSNNLSYSHKLPELEKIINSYCNTFEIISKAIKLGDVNSRIKEPLGAVLVRASKGIEYDA